MHYRIYTTLQKIHNRNKTLEQSKSHLKEDYENSLIELKNAAKEAKWLGLEVAAGHGLNYANLKPILEIPEIIELNIGQSIVARAIFTGLEQAIKDMVALLK